MLRDVDGNVIGKKTDVHAAVVAGDTIGDPFKDTSGPSLNILMKLMAMISLVFAKDQFRGIEPYEKFYIAIIIGVVFTAITVGLTLWMRDRDRKAKDAAFSTEKGEIIIEEDSKSISPVLVEA